MPLRDRKGVAPTVQSAGFRVAARIAQKGRLLVRMVEPLPMWMRSTRSKRAAFRRTPGSNRVNVHLDFAAPCRTRNIRGINMSVGIGSRPMTILSLDHVQLAMPPGREDEARAFYEKALQIPETPKPPHLAKRGGCWFERGSLKIHLGVELDFRPAKKAHPAFIVDDLARLSATLTSAGFPVRSEEPLEGYTRVYVDDPFGNRIELMEPDGRKSQ